MFVLPARRSDATRIIGTVLVLFGIILTKIVLVLLAPIVVRGMSNIYQRNVVLNAARHLVRMAVLNARNVLMISGNPLRFVSTLR